MMNGEEEIEDKEKLMNEDEKINLKSMSFSLSCLLNVAIHVFLLMNYTFIIIYSNLFKRSRKRSRKRYKKCPFLQFKIFNNRNIKIPANNTHAITTKTQQTHTTT